MLRRSVETTGFIGHYRSVWLSSLSRVALCHDHACKNMTPPHPILTPKRRPPTRTHASWRKYRGSLTSAFIHLAHSSRSTAVPPLVTQTIPYRPPLKLGNFPRHAIYGIAIASTGPITNRLSSSSAPVSHRYCGFMSKVSRFRYFALPPVFSGRILYHRPRQLTPISYRFTQKNRQSGSGAEATVVNRDGLEIRSRHAPVHVVTCCFPKGSVGYSCWKPK